MTNLLVCLVNYVKSFHVFSFREKKEANIHKFKNKKKVIKHIEVAFELFNETYIYYNLYVKKLSLRCGKSFLGT